MRHEVFINRTPPVLLKVGDSFLHQQVDGSKPIEIAKNGALTIRSFGRGKMADILFDEDDQMVRVIEYEKKDGFLIRTDIRYSGMQAVRKLVTTVGVKSNKYFQADITDFNPETGCIDRVKRKTVIECPDGVKKVIEDDYIPSSNNDGVLESVGYRIKHYMDGKLVSDIESREIDKDKLKAE